MPVRILPHTYRNRNGYLITGRPTQHPERPAVRIFTATRESAERIRNKVNEGQSIELADFVKEVH